MTCPLAEFVFSFSHFRANLQRAFEMSEILVPTPAAAAAAAAQLRLMTLADSQGVPSSPKRKSPTPEDDEDAAPAKRACDSSETSQTREDGSSSSEEEEKEIAYNGTFFKGERFDVQALAAARAEIAELKEDVARLTKERDEPVNEEYSRDYYAVLAEADSLKEDLQERRDDFLSGQKELEEEVRELRKENALLKELNERMEKEIQTEHLRSGEVQEGLAEAAAARAEVDEARMEVAEARVSLQKALEEAGRARKEAADLKLANERLSSTRAR